VRPRWGWWVGLVVALLAVSAVGFAGRDGPARRVQRQSIYTATVERGPMLRSVHARGVLVPRDIRWVTAETAGRVEEIRVQPGTRVEGDQVLVVLANSDLELQTLEAESELATARAQLVDIQAQLDTERLGRKAEVASLKAEYNEAKRRQSSNERLAGNGAVTNDDLEGSRERAQEAEARFDIGRKQLSVLSRSAKSRVEAQDATVRRLEAVVEFRRQQLERLSVVAGGDGVLQEMPLEVGQWVTPGTVLAKVVRPEQLDAELRIPEGQAKDVAVGQTASIDTRNGLVSGEVVRVEPTVVDGTVTVQVSFESALPDGLRPDLSIEGTIELERLDDVIQVARPVGVQAGMQTRVFRIDADGSAGEAIPVRFGRGSVEKIEVASGLAVGDEIVVSDTTAWGDATRIEIE
jgi:multidrug resistance efflux pump